jgi:hypothetical protein
MFRIMRVAATVALALGAGGAWAATNSCQANTTGTCAFGNGGVTSAIISGGGTVNLGLNISNSLPLGNNNLGGGSSANGSARLALNTRDTGLAAAGAGSSWNAWLSLSQNNIAYQFAPLQSSGRVNLSLIGVDYTFSNNVILGLAGGWDQTRVGTTFNGGNLNANGTTLAPYASWRITQNWNLDGSLGWGRANFSQTDNSVPGGITGNYSDKRSLGSLSLSYAQMVGKWQLTGRGSYLGSQDKLDQFTLSSGTTIAAATNNNGQVRVGGQAMYNGGVVLPYVGLYYFNNVQQTSVAAVNGQTPANARDGVQIQLGMQFAPKGPVYGGLMLATTQGQSQVKNDLFLANIGFRF